jgi:hypothetical protein
MKCFGLKAGESPYAARAFGQSGRSVVPAAGACLGEVDRFDRALERGPQPGNLHFAGGIAPDLARARALGERAGGTLEEWKAMWDKVAADVAAADRVALRLRGGK